MSNDQPGPTHQPYGQQPSSGGQPGQDPYGQPVPQSQPNPYAQAQPYGQQPYGQQPYGQPQRRPGERPVSVSVAAWIAIVMSALTALGFGFMTIMAIAVSGPLVEEINKQPEIIEAGQDAGDFMGVVVAVLVGFTIWSVAGLVLGIFTLRRSNAARILLVISSVVVMIVSLVAIGSIISALWLLAALATVILLFVGGANQWFSGGDPGYPTSYPQSYPQGGSAYGQQDANPYGQGQSGEGDSVWPPRDYPGRG